MTARRTDMPAEIARWVFGVIMNHHSPDQYARLQGLAKVLFIVPADGIGRRRMRQELARIHGVRGRRWVPQLSPLDRARVYVPLAERGTDPSGSKK